MAGRGILIFTDEMVNPRLATALLRLGYDAESCQRAGRANQGISDEDQLAYASQQGRAILTFNVADFERLDRRWKARGLVHHGIIVSAQITDLQELIRRVQLHLDTYSSLNQHNAVRELAS
jgi:predicted nuclease of predicted toxin-antitoxin system